MATPHLLMHVNHIGFANLCAQDHNIGDICPAEVIVDGVRTLLVSIYMNPNTSTDYIECFLFYNLMACSPKICTMWPRFKRFGYYTSIILTSYFSFSLRDHVNYEHSRSFALEELGLTLVTDPSRSTAFSGSCIDVICVRGIPHVRRYNLHQLLLIPLSHLCHN
jgi:hypothetical protein